MEVAARENCVRVFHCGPVVMELTTPDDRWMGRLESELAQFDAVWEGLAVQLHLLLVEERREVVAVKGDYLRCERYGVDRVGELLVGASRAGVRFEFDCVSRRAVVWAPEGPENEDVREELEQFVLLMLVWGWRRMRWTPMHVGSVAKGNCCALICAASGGGKSTFTASLIRRGWETLGDDKVLAAHGTDERVMLRGLSRSMNLDPAVGRWFAEANRLGELAKYSRWNEKRKVAIESLWPGRVRKEAVPTHLLKLVRLAERSGIRMERMESGETVETLARQVAMPSDREAVKLVMGTIAGMGAQVRGLRVFVGSDVYEQADRLKVVEEALGVGGDCG